MKAKQLISILLMLLLLTACSANTDLDLPDEAGSSEQTSNMDASAAEPEDGAEKPTLPEIETPEGAPDAELVETLLVTVVNNINGENADDGVELVIYAYDEQSQAFRVIFKTPIGPYVYPANTVDFEHQIVYYASARPDETYDNLYSCDLKTGNVQRLTDGKMRLMIFSLWMARSMPMWLGSSAQPVSPPGLTLTARRLPIEMRPTTIRGITPSPMTITQTNF